MTDKQINSLWISRSCFSDIEAGNLVAQVRHVVRAALNTQPAIRVTRIELTPTQSESLRCKNEVNIPGCAQPAAKVEPTAQPDSEITENDIKDCFKFRLGWNHSQADKARYRVVLETYERRQTKTTEPTAQPAYLQGSPDYEIPSEATLEMIAVGLEAYKATTKTIAGTGGNVYKKSKEERIRDAYFAMRMNEILNMQPNPSPPPVAGDAVRLDFVCNSPARYVEHSKNGMYRVYQDHAAQNEEHPLWVAMTRDYYATARDAIGAAIAAGGSQ